MLEKELNEFIKKSKKSLEKVEEKVESFRDSMSQDVSGFWGNLKNEFGQINTKLSEAGQKLSATSQELQLQGTLGLMEAKERLEKVKGTSEEFIRKVTTNTTQELDIARLQGHLAQMDAEDLWREKESQMRSLYHESKTEFETLAKKAGEEIDAILLKLTDIR